MKVKAQIVAYETEVVSIFPFVSGAVTGWYKQFAFMMWADNLCFPVLIPTLKREGLGRISARRFIYLLGLDSHIA